MNVMEVALKWTTLFSTLAVLQATVALYPLDGAVTGRYFTVFPVVMLSTNDTNSTFQTQFVRTASSIPIFRRILSTPYEDTSLTSDNIITFPKNFELNDSCVLSSKLSYLYVENSIRKTVTALARTYSDNVLATYTALSFNSLGTEYFVVTFCELNGLCQFAVSWIPTRILQNATVTAIKVTLPSKNPDLEVSICKKTYYSGETFTTHLTYGHTLQVQSKYDLTGTRIVSNHTTAVYSGSCNAQVHPMGRRGLMVEQLLPVSRMGKRFICYSYHRSANNTNFFRILGVRDNTTVSINSTTYKSLDLGQWYDFEVEGGVGIYITANQPISIVQFISGIQKNGNIFNPNMVQIQPVEGFQDWALYRSKQATLIDAIVTGTEKDNVKYGTSPSNFKKIVYNHITSIGTDIFAGVKTNTHSKRNFFNDETGHKFGGYVRAEWSNEKRGEAFLMMMEYFDLNISYPPVLDRGSSITDTTNETKEADAIREKSCMCSCPSDLSHENMTEKELEATLKKLKSELYVDKSSLSKTIRKKTSANDSRPSAQRIGLTGAVVLIFILVILIIPDVLNVLRVIRDICLKERNMNLRRKKIKV